MKKVGPSPRGFHLTNNTIHREGVELVVKNEELMELMDSSRFRSHGSSNPQ